MSQTPSTMLELGTVAVPFELPNMNNHVGPDLVASTDYKDQAILVAFLCNHCPYVVLLVDKLAELAVDWQQKGVNVVAISSNDVEHYPADAPDKMTQFSHDHNFSFPYLYDHSQDIAKAYKAACTPDFFLFNARHELVYRGQFDGARPGKSVAVTGAQLDQAVNALISGKGIIENQIASVGCNIKWKSGNAPDYF